MSQPYDDRPYPQQPPHPYGQMYSPPPTPQGPTSHAAPRRSQGLAITSLVAGVAGTAFTLLPVLRGVGIVIGLVAAILAGVALVSKSQGGTWFAVGGLITGLVALPLAFGLYMLSTGQDRGDQQQLQACIEANPDDVLKCAGFE